MNRHTKVAIDLDGVLADFASEWRRIVVDICKQRGIGEEQVKAAPTDYDLGSILLLPKDERENIVRLAWERIENTENFWWKLGSYSDSILNENKFEALIKYRKTDWFFITSRRPVAGKSVLAQTYYWLREYGWIEEGSSVIPVHNANDKVDLVQLLEIDYLLDDRFETIWRLNKRAPGKGWLMNRPWNQKPKDYAKDEPRVNSVQEFLDTVLT